MNNQFNTINNSINFLTKRRLRINTDTSKHVRIENAKKVDNYKLTHIETATPEKLLIMLYDGAIRFLNTAIQAIKEKQIETSHRNILKAEAIIIELMTILDMEVGGEIAINLFNLYDFMYRHLVRANISHNVKMLEDVIEILSELRGAWEQAAVIVSTMKSEGKLDDTISSKSITFAG